MHKESGKVKDTKLRGPISNWSLFCKHGTIHTGAALITNSLISYGNTEYDCGVFKRGYKIRNIFG